MSINDNPPHPQYHANNSWYGPGGNWIQTQPNTNPPPGVAQPGYIGPITGPNQGGVVITDPPHITFIQPAVWDEAEQDAISLLKEHCEPDETVYDCAVRLMNLLSFIQSEVENVRTGGCAV